MLFTSQSASEKRESYEEEDDNVMRTIMKWACLSFCPQPPARCALVHTNSLSKEFDGILKCQGGSPKASRNSVEAPQGKLF